MGGKDVSGIDGGGLLYSFIFATANARLWDYAECGEMVRGTYAAGCRNAVWGKGWIRALPEKRDSRKKEYVITDLGRAALEGELVRLKELVENGNRILGGGSDEESCS